MPEFTGTSDVRSYFDVLWRWKYLMLACLIAVPAIALAIKESSAKTYKATALVGVGQAAVNSAVLAGGSFSTSNVVAIADLVTTTPVAQVAAGLMHPPTSAGAITGEVTATGDPTTNFITIAASDQSPARAAAIANAFATAITLNQQQAAQKQLGSSEAQIRAQIARLSRRDPDRAQLVAQLAQIQASRATTGNGDAVLEAAVAPRAPTGLNTRRIIEVGLLIGLLLGIAVVVLAENADRRLRSPGELEALMKVSLLASLAPSVFNGRLDSGPVDEAAFQMLRTSLMFFNVDRQLNSVIVASPGEKDGKTTIATRLAAVTAASGKRVVLVDADLRRGQASERLSLGRQSGLSAVLVGEQTLDSALTQCPLPEAGEHQLCVLPAGPAPPDPSALLSSQEMKRVLRELEASSDLVIIDTPAALAVNDAVPLLRLVSGVILVARTGQATRQTVRRLQQMIVAAQGTLLGAVATGVSTTPGYGSYASSGYYGPSGNGAPPSGRLARLRHRRQSNTPTPEPGATPPAGVSG